ncbi:tetratricopeptide repeat protein [Streptomyces pseudovenezuelae]|uniref:tetratricopeptide repeat protein n=1 Tax=Streptomyces pseudovenezuelae TaxID=67350 RepID=UPI002E820468|nr:tetratricopeptide repeat protein [Streptomyces pseudovenezuelae]WUA93892.1 tetratricopeptide repeat protein [Streptomyces pseudovenezuelae]
MFASQFAFAAFVQRHGDGRFSLEEVYENPSDGKQSGTREQVVWPVRMGAVPNLASAFQHRLVLRKQIDQGVQANAAVVLTQVLAGGGGVGKSQLAAAYAHTAMVEGTDLVLWVDASRHEQVPASYARAALRVQAPGTTGRNSEQDARAFANWLASTDRSWLIVLDDITEPATLNRDRWWPPASADGHGRVLATTRRRDASLQGGGRALVPVDTYTTEESVAFLQERLISAQMPHLIDDSVDALGEVLGHLPLALGYAAAYMINEDEACSTYLARITSGKDRLGELLPGELDSEGYGHGVATALLLSLNAAQQAKPVGLAVPALHLAAYLAPTGHPEALWATPALTTYLSAFRKPHSVDTVADQATGVDAALARSVMRLLHRYALITVQSRGGPQAVRIHALTARAARETILEKDKPTVAMAAADALVELWPAEDHLNFPLVAVLRANADTIIGHADNLLWQSSGHRLIFLAGESHLRTGLHLTATTAFWERQTALAERCLGEEHPDTFTARANLADSYSRVGRTGQAIPIEESVLTDRERILGTNHPDTLTAREYLANSYQQAGRTDEAITLHERVVADRERILGTHHLDTLTGRSILAVSYQQAGRIDEAITLLEDALAHIERILGTHHPDTFIARANLAVSYQQAGRTDEAITLHERVVADRERILGTHHLDTLIARSILADGYRQAGRTDEAITLHENALADIERILGNDHPNTLIARANLADGYLQAGRIDDAIALEESVLSDIERILGNDHLDTLGARANLADGYLQAGRIDDAIALEESVLSDRERILGNDHLDTLSARANLAVSYYQAGRTDEAITLLELTLAGMRVPGAEHPNAAVIEEVLEGWRGERYLMWKAAGKDLRLSGLAC